MTIAGKVITVVLGVVIARGLGVEGYGIYTFTLAIMNLLVIPSVIGMPVMVMREIARKTALQKWGYIAGLLKKSHQTVFAASTLVATIFALIVWFSGYLGQKLSPIIFILMLGVLVVLSLSKVISRSIRGFQHAVIGQSFGLIIRPLLLLLFTSIGFYFYPELRVPEFAMAGQLCAGFVVLITSFITLKHLLPTGVRTAEPEYHTKFWIKTAIPFTLIGGANVLNTQLSTIILGSIREVGEVGLYRVAVQGAGLVALGFASIGAVISPQIARLHAERDMKKLQKLITNSTRITTCIALPVSLLLIFFGGDIAAWIFGTEYIEAHLAIAILSIGQLINTSFGPVGMLLNMTGYEKYNVKVLWTTMIISVCLCFLLIPIFGFVGAALGSVAGMLVRNILFTRAVRKNLGIASSVFST